MYEKIYRLKNSIDNYPYEVMMYDPTSDKPKPEWLTDILKFKEVEDGEVTYYESSDSHGVTYQVPCINGHLHVSKDEVVIYNLSNNNILSFSKSKFDKLYELPTKVTLFDRIKKFIRSL